MKYRLVRQTDEGSLVEEFDGDNVFPAMEVRGFAFTKFNDSKFQREEIRNAPKFAGLLGPMWDGDAVRYEDSETYRALSM